MVQQGCGTPCIARRVSIRRIDRSHKIAVRSAEHVVMQHHEDVDGLPVSTGLVSAPTL